MQKQNQHLDSIGSAYSNSRKSNSKHLYGNEPISSKTPTQSKLITGLSTDFRNSYSLAPNNARSTRNFGSMHQAPGSNGHSDQHLRRSHEIQPSIVGIQGRADMIQRKSQNYIQGVGADHATGANARTQNERKPRIAGNQPAMLLSKAQAASNQRMVPNTVTANTLAINARQSHLNVAKSQQNSLLNTNNRDSLKEHGGQYQSSSKFIQRQKQQVVKSNNFTENDQQQSHEQQNAAGGQNGQYIVHTRTRSNGQSQLPQQKPQNNHNPQYASGITRLTSAKQNPSKNQSTSDSRTTIIPNYSNPYFPSNEKSQNYTNHSHISQNQSPKTGSSYHGQSLGQKVQKMTYQGSNSPTSSHSHGIYTAKSSHAQNNGQADLTGSSLSVTKQASRDSIKPSSAKGVKIIKPTQVTYMPGAKQQMVSSSKNKRQYQPGAAQQQLILNRHNQIVSGSPSFFTGDSHYSPNKNSRDRYSDNVQDSFTKEKPSIKKLYEVSTPNEDQELLKRRNLTQSNNDLVVHESPTQDGVQNIDEAKLHAQQRKPRGKYKNQGPVRSNSLKHAIIEPNELENQFQIGSQVHGNSNQNQHGQFRTFDHDAPRPSHLKLHSHSIPESVQSQSPLHHPDRSFPIQQQRIPQSTKSAEFSNQNNNHFAFFDSHKQSVRDQEIINFNNVVEVQEKFNAIDSSHKDQKLGPESLQQLISEELSTLQPIADTTPPRVREQKKVNYAPIAKKNKLLSIVAEQDAYKEEQQSTFLGSAQYIKTPVNQHMQNYDDQLIDSNQKVIKEIAGRNNKSKMQRNNSSKDIENPNSDQMGQHPMVQYSQRDERLSQPPSSNFLAKEFHQNHSSHAKFEKHAPLQENMSKQTSQQQIMTSNTYAKLQSTPQKTRAHHSHVALDVMGSVSRSQHFQGVHNAVAPHPDWKLRINNFLHQQEILINKLHLEFKKVMRIDSIVPTLADAELNVNHVDQIVRDEIDEADDFTAMSKQHGRMILAAMTLLWLIQKEEQKLFDLQSVQISQILEMASQSAQTMQDIILSNQVQSNDVSIKRQSMTQKNTRSKLIIRSNITQVISLIKKVCRQAMARASYSDQNYSGAQKQSSFNLSKVGVAAFKQLVEISTLIEDDKRQKIKSKITGFIEETQQQWANQKSVNGQGKVIQRQQSRPETSKGSFKKPVVFESQRKERPMTVDKTAPNPPDRTSMTGLTQSPNKAAVGTRKYSAQQEQRSSIVMEPGRREVSASIGMTASPRSGEEAPGMPKESPYGANVENRRQQNEGGFLDRQTQAKNKRKQKNDQQQQQDNNGGLLEYYNEAKNIHESQLQQPDGKINVPQRPNTGRIPLVAGSHAKEMKNERKSTAQENNENRGSFSAQRKSFLDNETSARFEEQLNSLTGHPVQVQQNDEVEYEMLSTNGGPTSGTQGQRNSLNPTHHALNVVQLPQQKATAAAQARANALKHDNVQAQVSTRRRMSEPQNVEGVSQPNKIIARKNESRGFLPPMNQGLPAQLHRQFTLVLDLDETLVHFDQRKRMYRSRPHAHRFLSEMSKYYEIVIFTAGLKEYADWILDDLDRMKWIRYRLYRTSCKFRRGVYVKDLSRIGRDLSKTIIVDNIADNFDLQPDNGIHILSWFNNFQDSELLKLEPILKLFVENNVIDVRDMIKQYFKPQQQMRAQVASPNVNRQRKGSVPTHAHFQLTTPKHTSSKQGASGSKKASHSQQQTAQGSKRGQSIDPVTIAYKQEQQRIYAQQSIGQYYPVGAAYNNQHAEIEGHQVGQSQVLSNMAIGKIRTNYNM